LSGQSAGGNSTTSFGFGPVRFVGFDPAGFHPAYLLRMPVLASFASGDFLVEASGAEWSLIFGGRPRRLGALSSGDCGARAGVAGFGAADSFFGGGRTGFALSGGKPGSARTIASSTGVILDPMPDSTSGLIPHPEPIAAQSKAWLPRRGGGVRLWTSPTKYRLSRSTSSGGSSVGRRMRQKSETLRDSVAAFINVRLPARAAPESESEAENRFVSCWVRPY
jgi:hypothetical protein